MAYVKFGHNCVTAVRVKQPWSVAIVHNGPAEISRAAASVALAVCEVRLPMAQSLPPMLQPVQSSEQIVQGELKLFDAAGDRFLILPLGLRSVMWLNSSTTTSDNIWSAFSEQANKVICEVHKVCI